MESASQRKSAQPKVQHPEKRGLAPAPRGGHEINEAEAAAQEQTSLNERLQVSKQRGSDVEHGVRRQAPSHQGA
jgi:hypothetical protein